MGLFARGEDRGGDADPHQGGHHRIGQVPIVEFGQDQRQGPGQDLGETPAQLIGGGHGPVARVVGNLDPPSVDHDILRRPEHPGQHGEQSHRGQ